MSALSDGIFAVAMTLLVLDLHIPSAAQARSEWDLMLALGALGPQCVWPDPEGDRDSGICGLGCKEMIRESF